MIKRILRKKNRLIWASVSLYLLSRLVIFLMGIRLIPTYDYMFWLDTELLQHHLWESILYTHAFPPGMNILLGLALKIAPKHPEVLLSIVYLVSGVLFTLFFTYTLNHLLQLNRWFILLIVTFFHLSPPFIYFENFLYYTFPSAMLLCSISVFFHLAITRKAFLWWLALFSTCVLLSLLRATFHMVWLIMVLGIALIFEQKQYKTILKAFIAPFGLLLAFYIKNLLIFGFFGLSSWGGFNLSLNTLNQIQLEERKALVEKGELSPIYAFHPYSGPDAYKGLFDLTQNTGILALDQKMRPLGRPNYNHWIYTKVSPIRMQDSWDYIKQNPEKYFQTIWANAKQFFSPSTQWHPREPHFSPHAAHRDKLGNYERLYNLVLHRFPVQGAGLYIFFPFLLLAYLLRISIHLWRCKFKDAQQDKWIFLIGVNCLFVYLISISMTYGEMARYRFLIEPYIILFYAHALVWGISKVKGYMRK